MARTPGETKALLASAERLETRLREALAENDALSARLERAEQELATARWDAEELARLAAEANEGEKRTEARLERAETALRAIGEVEPHWSDETRKAQIRNDDDFGRELTAARAALAAADSETT